MLVTIMSMLIATLVWLVHSEQDWLKKITEGESEKEISEEITNGHVCQVKKNANVLFSGQ